MAVRRSVCTNPNRRKMIVDIDFDVSKENKKILEMLDKQIIRLYKNRDLKIIRSYKGFMLVFTWFK